MTTPGESHVMRDREISDRKSLVKRPVVSVLMLTYNHAPYIAQAIGSVLAQKTTFPFELIIGEDASTDATREIVMKYQREAPSVVRVIASDRNLGMHANHATLIEAARGEFIAYCEGDDYWVGRGRLQQQVDYLRAHPDCGLVHGNFLNLIHMAGCWRTRAAFRSVRQLQNRAGAIYAEMLKANRIQTCTVLCRRSMVVTYRESGPGVDGYMVGDWPLFLYLSHAGSVGFIGRPMAAYRRTPGSMMNSGNDAAVARGLDAIRMVGEFCDHFSDTEATRTAALVANYRALLWLAFRAGDVYCFDQAWQWLAAHEPTALRHARPRAMRALVGDDRTRTVALQALAGIEAAKHWFEFRPVGDGPGAGPP